MKVEQLRAGEIKAAETPFTRLDSRYSMNEAEVVAQQVWDQTGRRTVYCFNLVTHEWDIWTDGIGMSFDPMQWDGDLIYNLTHIPVLSNEFFN